MFDGDFAAFVNSDPVVVAPTLSVAEAVTALLDADCREIFISDGDKLLGSLSQSQALRLLADINFDRQRPLSSLTMTPVTAFPYDRLEDRQALHLALARAPQNSLPLIDANGRLVCSLDRDRFWRNQHDTLAALERRQARDLQEQNLLQDKLITSYSQLQSLLCAMQDIVLEIRLEPDNELEVGFPGSGSISMTPALERTLAYFFESPHAEACCEQIQRALNQNTTVRYEYHLNLSNDGDSTLWFEARISPLYDPQNDILDSVLWVARDITARKLAEDALKNLADELERRVEERTSQLRSTNQLLRETIRKRQHDQQDLQQTRDRLLAVLDAIPGFVSWFNAEGRYEGVNRNLANLYGLSPEGFIGRDLDFPPGNSQFADFMRHFLRHDFPTAGRVIDTEVGSLLRQYLVVAQKYDRGRAAITVGIDITERKQFEVALQQQQRLFQQIADASPDILYVYDLADETIVYINHQIEALTGYHPARVQALGSEFLPKILHPSDLSQMRRRRVSLQHLDDGELLESEYRLQTPTGEWRWMHSRELVLARDLNGCPEQIVGIAQDVTDRKNAEARLRQLNQELETKVAERTLALQRSEARFRSLFEQMAVGVAQVNLDGRWQFVNQKLCDILGYNPSELAQRTCLEMTDPEDLSSFQHCLQQLRQGEQSTVSLEKRYHHANGSPIWVNVTISIVRDTSETEYGSFPQVDPYFVVVVQDIRDRKQAEAALKHQKEILQTIFDRIPVAIAFLDAREVPQLINRCLEETLGWRLAELRQMDLFEAFYLDGEERDRARAFVQSATPGWRDFQVQSRDERCLDMSWATVRLSDNTTICIGQDITERKRAEAEVIKALEKERELIDLKSRFVSMTSHEFRTPLAIIKSSAQLLQRYDCDRDEQLEQLEQIQSAVTHMAELLDDVLTLAKSEAGTLNFNPTSVELTSFCTRLLQQLRHSIARDRQLNVTLAEAPLHLNADEKLLRQILTNLISNALKYSPPEKAVDFTLAVTETHVAFRVRDRGIGIPPEDQARLFESFHRAKNVGTIPGTGLGLAIVQRCIDLHGGTIAVSSQLGEGTQVTVSLPVTTPMQGDRALLG